MFEIFSMGHHPLDLVLQVSVYTTMEFSQSIVFVSFYLGCNDKWMARTICARRRSIGLPVPDRFGIGTEPIIVRVRLASLAGTRDVDVLPHAI